MIQIPGQGFLTTGYGSRPNEAGAEAKSESRRHIRLDAMVEQQDGSKVRVSAESVSRSVTEGGFAKPHEANPVYAQPKVARTSSDAEPTQAASNILGFIAQRLGLDAADGADTEVLQSRLEAGLEGFLKGYMEAREQLAGLGQLNGDVKDAVEKTYKDVLEGVAALAEEYGLVNPAESYLKDLEQEASDVDVSEIQQTVNAGAFNLSAEQTQARSFEFEVKTAEGDIVLIRALAEQNGSAAYSEGDNNRSLTGSSTYSSQFSFTVQGELNQEEVTAINDLLSQVSSISSSFYGGDLEGAFEEALNLGFDDEQIVAFSLNLSMSTYTRVENSYGEVAKQDHPGQRYPEAAGLETSHVEARVARMAVFIQQLEQMRLHSDELGVSREALGGLVDKAVGEEGSVMRQHADRFLAVLDNYHQRSQK